MPETNRTPANGGRASLHLSTGASAWRVALPTLVALAWAAGASAQWAPVPDPKAPRDANGKVLMNAPTPRTASGKPDLSGLWMRTRSGPPPQNGPGGGGGGGQLEPEQEPVPLDPNGPPIAAFFEAGQNIEGGLPYTPWAKELRDKRFAARAKDKGRRCDLEAGMAKLLGTRAAWEAADACVQIHGGNGYAEEYVASRILMDARVLSIFEGANEIQAHVIARRLIEQGIQRA